MITFCRLKIAREPLWVSKQTAACLYRLIWNLSWETRSCVYIVQYEASRNTFRRYKNTSMTRFMQLTDRITHTHTHTCARPARQSISSRIDDRNYDLSFTAGDARQYARSFGLKWDVKLRSGFAVDLRRRIVTLCRGVRMRSRCDTYVYNIYQLSPYSNGTIVPAHSVPRILFRCHVGYVK